jgi:short-subunit dehydrogenase
MASKIHPQFAGQTVVVTGASDGIGAELARQLAPSRPRLVLAARRIEALASVAAACEALGAQTLVVATDVGVEADCERLVAATIERFGGIDVFVNNAGVSGHALFDDVSDFGWYADMMRVNFFGALWCTHHALPWLKRSRGLLVGVASLAGKIGVPGRTAYSPSKFAMAGFFEALRTELIGTGVGVTMIFPGVVATGIRRRGYGADGNAAGVSGLDEAGAMPVDVCARLMIDAMLARRRELVMTARGRLGLWIKLIAPALVDRMALAALAKDGLR